MGKNIDRDLCWIIQNYPGYPELFMHELKIKGHIARNWGQKFPNFCPLNFCMSLISMHIALNPVKK
jgi:hypothetical protein